MWLFSVPSSYRAARRTEFNRTNRSKVDGDIRLPIPAVFCRLENVAETFGALPRAVLNAYDGRRERTTRFCDGKLKRHLRSPDNSVRSRPVARAVPHRTRLSTRPRRCFKRSPARVPVSREGREETVKGWRRRNLAEAELRCF